MPLPNEHAARQLDPGACGKIRRQDDALGKGVNVLWCVRPGKPVVPQSIHFDAQQFTPDEARAWLKKHDFSAADFEAATGKGKAEATAGPAELAFLAGGPLELQAQAAGAAPDGVRAVTLLAYTGVPMKLEGYFYPVVVDNESLKVPRQSIPILRGHDADRIAGHSTGIEVSAQRVRGAGVLSGQPEHTTDLLATAARGFPWQVSIGAQTTGRVQYVPEGETVKVNGRNWPGPVLVARNAVLREFSILPMGADGNTSAAVSG